MNVYKSILKWFKVAIVTVLVVLAMPSVIAQSTNKYVSTTGSDSNAGTIGSPLATIGAAVTALDADSVHDGNIIVRGGTYYLTTTETIAPASDTSRTLTISSASGETPVFRGDQAVSPTPLSGYSGVFLIPGTFTVNMPGVWDETLRARYNPAPDMISLQGTDYGVYPYSSNALAIHPLNGVLPAAGSLRMSILDWSFRITRNNVAISNLTFSGFSKTYKSAGLVVGFAAETQGLTDNVTITQCTSTNSYSGFYIDRGTTNAAIDHCYINDVASGINHWGGNATITYCNIFHDDGVTTTFNFRNPNISSGGYGVCEYWNSAGAVISHNLIVGFQYDIFIKTGIGPFLVQHNTLIDYPYTRVANSFGVDYVGYNSRGSTNAIVKYNIMYGQAIPFAADDVSGTTVGADIDKNIFYDTYGNNGPNTQAAAILSGGFGTNTVEDPLFVNPNWGSASDYHPGLGSPAITVSDDGYPVGALLSSSDSPQSFVSTYTAPTITPFLIDGEQVYTRANKYGFVVFINHSSGPTPWEYISYRKQGDTMWTNGCDDLSYQSYMTSPYPDMGYLGSQPLMVVGLADGITYEYRFNYHAGGVSSIYDVTTTGNPATNYVSTTGTDARTGGTKANPFATLQYAIDFSLPGDDIRLLPGVYFGHSVMFHSGVPGAPITIEADQPGTVSLNSQQLSSCVMLVSGVSNVIVKNLNVLWATASGMLLENCAATEIDGNVFSDSYIGADNVGVGRGLLVAGGQNINIHNNMFICWYYGADLEMDSATGNIQFTHNTVVANVFGLIYHANPSSGDQITYNSMNYDDSNALELHMPSGTEGNVTIDYNNYGTTFQSQSVYLADSSLSSLLYPLLYSYDANHLMVYYVTTTPSIIYSFSSWKSTYGYDAHSIFADPKWVNPSANNFYLKSGSPNILDGGDYIGAYSIMPQPGFNFKHLLL